MKTITSRDNPQFKELRLLAGSSAARRKAGQTLLDGVHLCAAYLDHLGAPAMCVVSETGLVHHEVAPIVDRSRKMGTPCLLLPDKLFEALSQVEHGVGLLFLVPIPRASTTPRLESTAILLDGLQDPGNLGSILRSAAAAGIKLVLCGTGTVAAWSPKVLRAGMGAHFLLTIAEDVKLADAIRNAGVPVLATSSHASRSLYEIDLKKPVAWLFGNEGRGVSSELLELASQQIAIPHPGQVESLNVAACAAVCLFEQVRQHYLPRHS